MKLWLGLLLLWPVSVLAAETVVVKDVLPINVRSGPGTSFSIVAAVKSGQKLTVLEKKSGYYKVRTPKSNEGWVLARFVQSGPVAQEQLKAVSVERDNAVEKLKAVEQEFTQLRQRYDDLNARFARLQSTVGAAPAAEVLPQKASAPSATPTPMPISQMAAPEADFIVASPSTGAGAYPDLLKRSMLLGAGLLLAGILLGLIIPLLRPRKRS